jgi:hypothetical protein
MELTQEIMRELLDYDKNTGVFIWKARGRRWFKSEQGFKGWNNRFAGTVAGTIRKNATDYPTIRISVFGKLWLAHRLAFIYMGEALPEQVDHLNRDSTDNRWNNLSASSAKENMKNMSMPITNTSGVTGVSWNKARGKWVAYVGLGGKNKHLGLFTDLEEATEVVRTFRAAKGFSSGHGKELAKYLEKSVDS